jgi:hypothetical protein
MWNQTTQCMVELLARLARSPLIWVQNKGISCAGEQSDCDIIYIVL